MIDLKPVSIFPVCNNDEEGAQIVVTPSPSSLSVAVYQPPYPSIVITPYLLIRGREGLERA